VIENFKLRVFRVVADSLNFRRAAEELHLTQPAITSQIKTLEESLGLALFDRIGRDINLTPAGTTLLQYVRQIEAISNEAVAALASLGGQEGADLSIGASPTIAVYLLPSLLAQVLKDWPRLKVHVMVSSTNDVLHALTTHRIGIGLIEAPAFRPDLKCEVFDKDELTLIMRPDHRWAKKAVVKAGELVHEPILLREVGSGMRRFVEEYLERNGVLRQQLRTTVDMTSTEAIVSAVEAGIGIGFAPCLALENHPIHQIQSRTYIREPAKPTARADTVTCVRRSRQRVVDKRLVRRRDKKVRSIAQIAMRRVDCQTGQDRAQQPCDIAGPCCACTIHAANYKSRLAKSRAG
jgi:DNA-binding transcriptional LysR family regulator